MSKAANTKRLSLGLMSGTSMDGIDATLTLTAKGNDTLLLHKQLPYPTALRSELLALLKDHSCSLAQLMAMNYAVGNAFADAAAGLLKDAKKKKFLSPNTPLVIGSHGQTIFHNPDLKQTMQIGEASLIAARTGYTTVSDFRMADTAVGGEGAPLLPFYHQRLFAHKATKGVAIHNLGGISNFTYLGPKGKIFALDTGPANCLLDAAIFRLTEGKFSFDKDGAFAARGAIHQDALDFLLKHDGVREFLSKPAPKSTGRELFSIRLLDDFFKRFPRLSLENALATLTALSVETMRLAYSRYVLEKRLPLKEIIFCGGGTQNAHLLSSFQKALPMIRLSSVEDYGVNPQALEAQAFGIFAWMCLDKKPITFPSTTGAKQSAICGKISWPPTVSKTTQYFKRLYP